MEIVLFVIVVAAAAAFIIKRVRDKTAVPPGDRLPNDGDDGQNG